MIKGAGPGRPKGSGSRWVREIVERRLDKNIVEAILDLAEEQPRLRWDVYKELLPYCHSKVHTVEAEIDMKVESDAVNSLASVLLSLFEIEGQKQ